MIIQKSELQEKYGIKFEDDNTVVISITDFCHLFKMMGVNRITGDATRILKALEPLLRYIQDKELKEKIDNKFINNN